MADNTQGKATQKDPGSGSNARAADKGKATAAGRDEPEIRVARSAAPGRQTDDKRPSAEEINKREPKVYRAIERGYVDGRVVEPGEVFSTKMDQGLWMEPVKKGDAKYGAEEAADEAQYSRKVDVNYEGMSEAGLEALAALVGVSDPGKLKKDELVAAIRAARDNTR